MGADRFYGLLNKTGFRRILAFVLTTMLILLVIVFVRFRVQFDTAEKPEPPEDTEADLTIKGFRHTADGEDRTSWTVYAESARLFSDRDLAELSEVDLTFFTKDGSPVHLSAKEGKMNTETRDISVSGSVLCRHKDYILMTENLHYRNESNIIYTDTPLAVTGNDSSSSADSGKFELDTGTLNLDGHVLVRMNQIDDF
ncbi:MAG: LPS export ABC transporter periplasmic protein LptC [Desulfosalsimonas sp.]